VTAFNTGGFSNRSSVWHFTIQTAPQPPAAPILSQPVDGFISASAYLNFDWNDPPTATRYTIQIDSDSLFSPVIISDTTLVASNYANSDSLLNGQYFWRVKAGNAFGWSGYSSIWEFNVVAAGCPYTIGDANGNGAFNGLDVTYSVGYFKGGPPPPFNCNCPPHGVWYVAGDVNASCSFNGLDVTYMVAYFKGGPTPNPCPDCPPSVRFRTTH
jgi:hypothetical protein